MGNVVDFTSGTPFDHTSLGICAVTIIEAKGVILYHAFRCQGITDLKLSNLLGMSKGYINTLCHCLEADGLLDRRWRDDVSATGNYTTDRLTGSRSPRAHYVMRVFCRNRI